METYIVHLYFNNALHIGSDISGIDIEATQDFIHSDTLWSAIANHWAVLDEVGDISFDDFLNGFRIKQGNKIFPKEKPLFRISSAFPLTDNERVYWLPKPISVPVDFSKSNIDDREYQRKEYGKKVKKEKFITLNTFKEWINFEKNASSVGSHQQKGISIGQIRSQASLDRVSMQAKLYHSGLTYFDKFQERVGLYFLLQCEESVKTALELIFKIIYEVGALGGNRNIGLGSLAEKPFFKKATEFKDLFNTENFNAHCLLSLCYLHVDEITDSEKIVAYNPILRKGWTGSLSVGLQRKRQTIYMLSEGSVIEKKLSGCLADITPDINRTPEWTGLHDVYRYGYALSVPIKIDLND
jgi:CRISPR-associated protein Csm4